LFVTEMQVKQIENLISIYAGESVSQCSALWHKSVGHRRIGSGYSFQ